MVAVSGYLSSVPYFPVIHRYERAFQVDVYADMVDIWALNPPLPENMVMSTRKKVAGFSDKSRKRMIEFLAKVEDVPNLFVTLTYSDDVVEYAYLNMHTHFEAFRKRLERAYSGIRAIWRIEFKVRKSGRFKGELKPHFHLLVWLPCWMTDVQKEFILKNNGEKWRIAWHEIVGSQDAEHLRQYGCDVQACRSRKHAYSYASKYMSKDDEEQVEAGRRWGRIGTFETDAEIETFLTSREYIHFKRMLNAYIKSEALKAYKRNQENPDLSKRKPLKHFLAFYKSFVRYNIKKGSVVFGLGYISQSKPIGLRTIVKMLRLARELALDKPFAETSKSPKGNREFAV